jgi:hypothetical protein
MSGNDLGQALSINPVNSAAILPYRYLVEKAIAPDVSVGMNDANAWIQSYFGALEQAGILRPVDSTPPIRTQPVVASLLATLATGVLLGRTGQTLVSTGDLIGFFENIRKWYGQDQLSAIPADAEYFSVPVPDLSQFDLHLTSPTHTEGINVYVPYRTHLGSIFRI